MQRIYLDYNATAPLRPEALAAMQPLLQGPHNASSIHYFGRKGRKAVETARDQIAALLGLPAGQIIFNSGATEGNNTVLRHFDGERILISATEHPSIIEAAPAAEKIPVNTQGLIDLAALEKLLKAEKTALVSVMFANNETGVIQPVQEIAALAHKHGALFHCDAVQAAGRIAIDMPTLGIDFLTLSAHKLGGPQGVGALALGLCGVTPTLLHGGGQEKRARAGTENVAGIAGFGAAAKAAQDHLHDFQVLEKLCNELESALIKHHPDTVIFGQDAPRIANTTLFAAPDLAAETALIALDLDGIAVSNGSACSSGRVEPSHVLRAMKIDPALAAGAIRISLGWATQPGDIEAFIAAWTKLYQRSRKTAHA